MRLFQWGSLVALGFLIISQSGCGGSASSSASSASVSSLSQLPDPASMVSTSTSSTGLSLASVSGTAPLITALKDDPDQYFWNDLVATISASTWADKDSAARQADARNFWGGVSGGPAGQGGCFMAQNVGQVFGRLLDSAGSSCYMKSMPDAASGVTISPTPSGGNSNLFTQEAADKLVKVAVSGDEDQGNGGGTVFIKIYGTDSVTSDVYKAQLYFCHEGTVNGSEVFQVNKSDLTYAASSTHQEGGGGGFESSVSASLKAGSSSSLDFDPSKDRVISMTGSFGNDSFKAKITITSDNLIYSMMRHENDYGSDKISSVSEFSGTDANTVRFLAAGFKGLSSWGDSSSHSFSEALEWHDTYYAAVDTSSNDLFTKADSVDLSTDTFYSGSISPSISFTGLDCSATADYAVTMDFTDANVAAIKTKCDGNRKVDGDGNSYCWSGAVQTAQEKIRTQCQSGGGC